MYFLTHTRYIIVKKIKLQLKKEIKTYDITVTEMNDIMECELFIYAFRLGGRFMLETLSNER